MPDVIYPNRNSKLVCGVVFRTLNQEMDYYVGLTSYTTQKSENILIKTEDLIRPIKGSLRFNYMFPVPAARLTIVDINRQENRKYKGLLNEDYKFIDSNREIIFNKAKEVYEKISKKNAVRLYSTIVAT